jgi:hypothetical protein
MSEQPESNQSESSESQSKVREVFIVKRSTKMDSDEYVSVQLKSSEDSIEKLLKKAVLASVLNTPQKSITTKGVQ